MKPNLLLKHEREIRGWSQARVAEEIGSTDRNVSRWERGISAPYPHFREKLCTLFGKSAKELGFLMEEDEDDKVAISLPERNATSALTVRDPLIPPLSTASTGLIGREALLHSIRQRLCAGKHIALSGLPGVGKTALALALAHDTKVREVFSDGIVWAGLGPRPNVPGQLSRWGNLLGIDSHDVATTNSIDAWSLALRAVAGTRRMLLVVDDVWEIEAALPFKVGGPECAFLITTRFPRIALHFAREGATPVHELSQNDGVILLEQLAPEPVAHDRSQAETLVQEVGALPLALTLMGRYLQVQSYSGQPRRIQAAIARLRDVPQRLLLSELQSPIERSPSLDGNTPLSLQSAIAVSDRQLATHERTALRALSIFPAKPNSFSEEAALAVSQASVETLDALSDAGLLECSGLGRYTLHQTIADYASAHLTDTTVSERLMAYMISYAEEHETDHDALQQESNNILAALTRAFTSGHQARFVRGVNVFVPFLMARGLYDVARLHVQRAYYAAGWLGDKRSSMTALFYLGDIASRRQEYGQAASLLGEGLAVARELDDVEQIHRFLTLLDAVATAMQC